MAQSEFDHRVRINNLGFRGEDIRPDKSGQLRILAVGDSMTFGWGVEDNETYPSVLERLLAEHTAREIEVVNAGFAAGYFPATYYVFLKEKGLALEPDLIVVGFFVGNDLDLDTYDSRVRKELDENGFPTRIQVKRDTVFANYWMSPWGRAKYKVPILRESHVYLFAIEIARRVTQRFDELWSGTQGKSEIPEQYRPDYGEEMQRIVADVQRLFREMHEMARRQGIPLVVIMIPEYNQVKRKAKFVENGADLEKPQRIFSTFFEAEGIPYLDLLGGARERGLSLYYRQDQHFTPEGQAFAAARLADFLQHHGLVSAQAPSAR